MNFPPLHRFSPARDAHAFALVVVLAILAMLLVLVVSLSTVLHVETRSSASSKDLTLARQNALLGLEIAIGQLQEYAGKDQAVTFPATTYYPEKGDPKNPAANTLFKFYKDHAQSGSGVLAPRKTWMTDAKRGSSINPANNTWEKTLRDWWSGRNPRWTGIMDASLRRDGTRSDKYGEFKRDQLPVWLVSGNEKFTINGTMTAYPSGYQTPDTALPDPVDPNSTSGSADAKQVVWLVGEGSATLAANSTDGLDGRVKVRKQPINSTGNTTIGHYAYWVGDESTKANFAVRDPWFNETNLTSPEYRNRLQVPQRIGWENIQGFTNNGTLVATFEINDTRIDNISTSREIALLENNKKEEIFDASRQNFHSLTAFSRSLLTDTALGGLKKDLSNFFEGSGSGLNLNSPVPDRSLYDPSDPRFGGTSNDGFPRTSASTGLPTWGDLKKWYDNDQGTLGPVLAHYQIFTAFTHRNGEVQFHVLPLIFLWNPYNTPLSSATYTLEMRHNIGFWGFGFAVKNDEYVDPTPPTGNSTGYTDGHKVGNYYIPPIQGTGWFNSSTSNFKRSGINFNTSNSTSEINNNLWIPNSANQWPQALPGPGFRFKPFDRGSTTDGVSLPTDPNSTWVPYRITTSFAPGEVKVFSVKNSQQVNPANLHDGSSSVTLENYYDPAFPASYWFPIATGLNREPGTPAADSDDVRWIGHRLPANTPPTISARLKRGGSTLWEFLFTGTQDNSRWYRSVYFPPPSMSDPDVNNSDQPATWKKVFAFNNWETTPKDISDTRLRESPIQAMAGNRITPFTPPAWKIFSSPNFAQSGVNEFVRFFANHNPSAVQMDPIAEIEFARSRDGINNQDGFQVLRWWVSASDFAANNWSSDQVSGDSGFALFTWQNRDPNNNNKGISNLQLRVAREDFNLLSLGQLQQANIAPYSWQPGFTIGNSEASPYVDRGKAAGLQSYQVHNATGTSVYLLNLNQRTAGQPQTFRNDNKNRFLDLSYVMNEALWDRYFLSSIPQNGSLNLTQPLPNSRHRFRESAKNNLAELQNFNLASAHLDNIGALNINSTSVEAWKALLTAFRDLKIQGGTIKNPDDTVPISRNMAPQDGPINFTDTTRTPADYGANSSGDRRYDKLFQGFRYLTDGQIRRLAERIVDEIRLRGPFFSLSDFVNRRLVSPDMSTTDWLTARTSNQSSDKSRTHSIGVGYDPFVGLSGINGALQRAINLSGINGGINYPFADDQNDRVFRVDADLSNGIQGDPMSIYAAAANYLDTEHLAGVPAGEVGQLLSHAPGFVTQGDLLAMIGPALTPRGDTFLIRTYGDVTDKSGKVVSRAWLEAVVQREVEPVTPKGNSGLDKWTPADKFGRKFKVVKMRWLSPEDV